MNKNVNVFIAVLLCALLCGGVMWLRMASEEKLGLNVQDTYDTSSAYSSGASYADATFVGPSSGGMMSVTSSRRSLRTRAASSYASSAATQPLTSNLSPLTSHLSPLTSSPTGGGLYTTSSQTFKSFGGGNNAGVSMSGGSLAATNNYAQTSSAVSISSPISLISTSLPTSEASYQTDNSFSYGDAVSAVMAANSIMGTSSLYGAYSDIYASATDYAPISSNYNSLGGRLNLPGSGGSSTEEGFGDEWLTWLWQNYGNTTWGFTYEQLEDAYNKWRAAWELANMGGTPPSFSEFLAWFKGNGGEHTWTPDGGGDSWTYYWLPVGGILPLLVLGLLYILCLSVRVMKIIKE